MDYILLRRRQEKIDWKGIRVDAFQRAFGLYVDGIWGEECRRTYKEYKDMGWTMDDFIREIHLDQERRSGRNGFY